MRGDRNGIVDSSGSSRDFGLRVALCFLPVLPFFMTNGRQACARESPHFPTSFRKRATVIGHSPLLCLPRAFRSPTRKTWEASCGQLNKSITFSSPSLSRAHRAADCSISPLLVAADSESPETVPRCPPEHCAQPAIFSIGTPPSCALAL